MSFAIATASASPANRLIPATWTERLLATHRHAHRDVREHRRLKELALDATAADEKLSALSERVGDVALDLRHGGLVDQEARPGLLP